MDFLMVVEEGLGTAGGAGAALGLYELVRYAIRKKNGKDDSKSNDDVVNAIEGMEKTMDDGFSNLNQVFRQYMDNHDKNSKMISENIVAQIKLAIAQAHGGKNVD